MKHKIFLGTELTNLELYIGVITQFAPPTGDLVCRNIVVLAENTLTASVLVAQQYPDWDLQSLTCLTDMPWFDVITLDDNCPQAATLRQFVIPNVEAVHEDDTSQSYGLYRRWPSIN